MKKEELRFGARYVDGLFALRTLLNLKLNLIALIQGLLTIPLNGAEMDKHIFAVLRRDKTVSLLVAEPLDCSFWHLDSFFHKKNRKRESLRFGFTCCCFSNSLLSFESWKS